MSDKDIKPSGYRAPAVSKSFRILKALSESRGNLSLSELAHRLGFSKSTTHGLVHALIREGAIGQTSRGKRLFLGATIFELAFGSWNFVKITEKFQPHLNTLRSRIGETVFLGALIQYRILIMAIAEAAKPLNISASPGTSIPQFAGAVGKVFLAAKPAVQARSLIRKHGLPHFTPRSITDENHYLAELARVRDHGYSLDNEEYIPGVKAVAAPLGNQSGLPMAIWVVGFAGSIDDRKMLDIIGHTLDTAQELNAIMEDGL